jgi:hypothetical protein
MNNIENRRRNFVTLKIVWMSKVSRFQKYPDFSNSRIRIIPDFRRSGFQKFSDFTSFQISKVS